MVSQNGKKNPTFSEAVELVLVGLAPGEVLSYGEVAEEAGFPGGARAVGQFLKRNSGFAWWRVVTAAGRLTPGNELTQASLLRAEGVAVQDGYVVDMR
mgnify:CR=1 FL=1